MAAGLRFIIPVLLLIAPRFLQAQPEKPARPSPSPSPPQEIKSIWDYQDELDLTPDQVARMKDLVLRYKRTVEENRAKMLVMDEKIKRMITEEAPIHLIRSTLQTLASVQVELRIEDLLTSRKINAILSADQLKQWHKIQNRTRGEK